MNNTDNILKLSKMFCFKAANHTIDLTNVDNFSYSAVMREINKCCNDDQIQDFLSLYKRFFDEAINKNLQKPDRVALQNTIIEFSKNHEIKISKDLIKNASITELGSAEDVGSYIANVIHFLMSKISNDNRQKSINNLKNKLLSLNPTELSNKDMPNSAAIGQSITFVKNILFNHNANFIKEVLRNVVNKL